ncbi:MAG: endonuclease/exonuclease/phosphatase family protein [Ferruginibacter sp.]
MPKSIFRRLSKKFFIVTNIVVAVLFLLGCYAKWFNPSFWWPIGLLTLGSFYLFVILLLFIIFWFFAKARWSLISFITMLLAFNPIRNIIPFHFSSSFKMQQQDSALRIMSWNVAQFDILHSKKQPEIKNDMGDLINDYHPDIACFQEMVAGDSTPDLNINLYKKYLYYPLDSFAKHFNFPYESYAYNYKENYIDHQHFGIVIFSKYPIINKQTISFPPHDYNSIFQYADIVKNNDTIRVFNIHLQSLKFTTDNLKYIEDPSLESDEDLKKSKGIISKLKTGFVKRGIQADRIKEEVNKSPYPVIICGDFNDLPNSYAYGTIGKGLKNAFEEKGSGLGHTFNNINAVIRPPMRIDNIFADGSMDILQYTCIRKKLSDHYPVITDIQIKNKE